MRQNLRRCVKPPPVTMRWTAVKAGVAFCGVVRASRTPELFTSFITLELSLFSHLELRSHCLPMRLSLPPSTLCVLMRYSMQRNSRCVRQPLLEARIYPWQLCHCRLSREVPSLSSFSNGASLFRSLFWRSNGAESHTDRASSSS